MYTDTQAIKVKEEHTELAEKGKRYAFLFSPLWLCLLVAFGIRIFLIIHTNNVIEGDESLVGIQAIRILHGNFPVYFYGQPYMGSLEAYFAAILFAIFGPSVWALRMVGALLSLVIVWLTWRLAGALSKSAGLPKAVQHTFKIITALCAAIPPLYDGVLQLHMLGGYIETFILMLLLLLCAFQLTRRWKAGVSYRELVWRWVGIGFVVGLGLWIDPLITSAIFAIGCWILGHCLLEMRKRRRTGTVASGPWWLPACELLFAFTALPASLVGLAPAIGWGATHQWANLTYIFTISGNETLHQKISNTLKVTESFVTCVSPRLIGGALPIESPLSLALHTGLFIIGCISIAATCLLFLWACLYPQSWLAPIRQLIGLPMLFAACSIFLFCISSASTAELIGCHFDNAGRYAAPLMLALPFILAVPFTLSWFYLHSKKATETTASSSPISEPRRSQPLLYPMLTVLSALLLAGFLGTQALTYRLTSSGETYQSNYCAHDPFDNGPILAYLQRQHIHYIWANNFLAYPLVFKSNLSVIGSDPQSLFFAAVVNRIPSDTEIVLHADRPSMLVLIPHDDLQPSILQTLSKLHVIYRTARFYAQPGYDVLVVTPLNHTVTLSNLAQIDSSFSCVAH